MFKTCNLQIYERNFSILQKWYKKIQVDVIESVPGPPIDASRALKVDPTVNRVLTGRKSSMITIMIGKMEMVFPDMYLLIDG